MVRKHCRPVLIWQKRLTINLALSDSCCATCLASTAPVYSLLKVRLVMETSSSRRLKYFARAVSNVRMSLLTTCAASILPQQPFLAATMPNGRQGWAVATDCSHDPEARAHLTHGKELRGIVLRNDTLQGLLHRRPNMLPAETLIHHHTASTSAGYAATKGTRSTASMLVVCAAFTWMMEGNTRSA